MVSQEPLSGSGDPQLDLVEAIAWWRVDLPDALGVVTSAASELLATGDDRPSVVELASTYTDADWYAVNSLVERVIDDLDCRGALARGAEIIATRRLCRLVLSGGLPPWSLTGWLYDLVGYDSEWEVLTTLVSIHNAYDGAGWRAYGPREVDEVVRKIAQLIVDSSNETVAEIDIAQLDVDRLFPYLPFRKKRRRRTNPWTSVARYASQVSLFKPPFPDTTLDPFRGGVGVLTQNGEFRGHVLTIVSTFMTLFTFRAQWWVWYIVVRADGTQERSAEDYPPFLTVTEMKNGRFEANTYGDDRNGHYDFAWLAADEAAQTRERLGVTDSDF